MGFIERLLSWLGVEPEPSGDGQGAGQVAAAAEREIREPVARRGRVVSLPGAGVPPGSPGSARPLARLVIYGPRAFDDVQAIALHLREGRPVVLTLKATDRETARRIVDFLSGAVYALDGNMRRIDDDIFLCAPSGVDVQTEGLSAG